MHIVSIYDCFPAVFSHVHHRSMICFIGRYQTIKIALQNDGRKPFEMAYRFPAEQLLFLTHACYSDVKTEFTHHGHIHPEFQGLPSPPRNVRTQYLGREKLGKSPLNENTFQRIGIVTRPKFRKILQCFVIATGAPSRTQHHGQMRIFGFQTFQYPVNAPHMVYIQLRLFFFQIRRIDIGYRTVAIPFEKGDFRIFRHESVNNAINKILHFRITQVQYQLIPEIIQLAVGQVNDPFRVFFKQFAFRIYHFGFYPDTEFHACFFRPFYQCSYSPWQFCSSCIPITQSRPVVFARILIAEPSIVQ